MPLLGGILVPFPDVIIQLPTGANGTGVLEMKWPTTTISDLEIFFQTWVLDPGAVQGVSASNALQASQP